MAGSYRHCVDDQGRFIGVRLLDHLGDAYEALEEMYGMIWLLAVEHRGDPAYGDVANLVERSRQNYQNGIQLSPGIGQITEGEEARQGEEGR